ncbi:MAG TPA: flagellar motor protein MotB [Candidatus Methylomirabilis sp.]|nr:flagellar motor protein MotB [Candidatus Methylomirabilis sp.]
MSSPVEVPRRIVKKRGGHGGHHGGAWKVAYADFVTAMMALFIVLWIVGQSKDVKDSVAAYFKDPSAFQKGSSKLLKGGEGAGGALPAMPIPAPPPSEPEQDKKRGDRETLEAAASSLREQIHREAHLALLEDKIKIELTDEGLRIQLVETGQGAFFDVGSAKVKPSTREVLAIIAREVGKLPNEVIMEGHTDTRPYVGQPSYTNWELSADRANAARRILEIEGLRHAQIIRVVGYADRQLANRDDPLDAANRRISIIVNFRKESSRAAAPREPRAAS